MNARTLAWAWGVAAIAAGLMVTSAWAHKASDAYLQWRQGDGGTVELRVDVALRDLDLVADLDDDADGRITWAEVQGAWPRIDAAVVDGVRVPGCPLAVGGRALERRGDGAYAALTLTAACPGAQPDVLRYTLLRDVDRTHRGLLRVDVPGGQHADAVRVLDPTREPAVVPYVADPPPAGFFAEGIRHIVTGYDHLLFLICLLLPAVMRRVPGGGWQPVGRRRDALGPVAGVVTAFTAAHSVTLTAAAFGWLQLQAAVIEPAIAATIVLAALDNLRPVLPGPRWAVAFAFGLIHGFGFAGVLAELGLPPGEFAWALLRFNLGLEAGQLAIVGIAVLALFLARRRRAYPRWVIGGGSLAAMAMGALWFVERIAELPLSPG